MQLSIDTNTRSGTLTVAGTLMIDQADELKNTLIDGFEQADTLTVNGDSLTGIDLACLQLFCAAGKEACRGGKTILLGTGTDAVHAAAVKAGFLACTACCTGPTKTCLWK